MLSFLLKKFSFDNTHTQCGPYLYCYYESKYFKYYFFKSTSFKFHQKNLFPLFPRLSINNR